VPFDQQNFPVTVAQGEAQRHSQKKLFGLDFNQIHGSCGEV
jgi:hypothetical protein